MPCDACQDNRTSSIILNPNSNGCTGCEEDDCQLMLDASCIKYTGPALSCSMIASDSCLETVLLKLDEKICSIGAGPNDYQSYALGCLRTDYTISNAQQFAEAIADYSCKITERVTTTIQDLTGKINETSNAIALINNPQITGCPASGITPADELPVVLSKLKNLSCDISSKINPAAANWNSCFALVGTPPATVVEGFNKVLEFLCSIKNNGGANLPVFNNTQSCLPGTASDDLEKTVLLIRSRLCQVPVFNPSNITAQSCFAITAADTLETIISGVVSQVNKISMGAVMAVDANSFSLQDIAGSPCNGKKLVLNGSISDRLVAASATDSTPGTLDEKLQAGTGIQMDKNGDKLIISANAGAGEKVKINSSDPIAGYLTEKITGSSGDVKIETAVVNGQLQIAASVFYGQLIERILDTITESNDLKQILCDLVRSCPSPCTPPQNVQIVLA